ncbi:MAG: FAD-dependent oxidoreductase [Candidatus Daviesbacteria bacterium]|nr:FAD-dependent oxidoreductase [Candidatus Daviesbacteria bacterium]
MKLKILEIKQESNNCFSLILEKQIGFQFYPGQFLDIELNIEASDKRGKVRAFTISSSPSEDFLMITPKKGISDFKKAMEKLKPGEFINSSHPAGTFILDESSPAVMIAGGIGITPFRSTIKYALDQKLKTKITLIYSNFDDNFIFKDELDEWKKNINLKIIYYNSTQSGHLTKLPPFPLTLSPIYYLAGSHSFVNSMEKNLLEVGVDQINIRYDRFDGY